MVEISDIVIEIFALGGDGSSVLSRGNTSGIVLFFALFGYFISHFFGRIIKKLFKRELELFISFSFALLASLALIVFAWQYESAAETIAFVTVCGIWGGWFSAFFDIWFRIKKKAEGAREKLKKASAADNAWDESAIVDHAKQIFIKFQEDWSSFNTENMSTYMNPSYLQHNSLILRILSEMKRMNRISNIDIEKVAVVEVLDRVDNTKDKITVSFIASSKNELIDTKTNKVLFTDKSSFAEYWTFNRSGSTWLLDKIDREAAGKTSADKGLARFASKNKMFYALNMGWLFLPQKGELFETGKFGKSDINNHFVGTYRDHLVQLYTYLPNISNAGRSLIVSQINLPKYYGGIIIKPKKDRSGRNLEHKKIDGCTKFEFEWPDFNKRYEVYATDADKLATFELLNPAFMSYLYDTDTDIAIEVTDNVAYLYKKPRKNRSSDYKIMMDILLKACHELKL